MLAYLNNNLEINLRYLDKKDDLKIRKWLQDPYVFELTFVIPGPDRRTSLPFDEKTMDQYVKALLTDQSRRTFAIEVEGEHVGNVGLKEINNEKRKAELFVEIGEAEYRGKGIGRVALGILLDYAMFEVGLEEMCLEVLEFNQAALRVYKMLGFQISHRSGWHYDAQGRYWQVWWMRLPKQRWLSVRDTLLIPGNLIAKPLKAVK